MAMVYQNYKSEMIDGTRVDVLDKRGNKIPLNWFARINTHDGRRKKVKLAARTEAEAKREATAIEARQRQMKNGVIPVPTLADKLAMRPFGEVVSEYLEWGNAQGGRGGRPWSPIHAHDKKSHLEWWKETLRFSFLSDASDCLPAVEKALREVSQNGRLHNHTGIRKTKLTGKTLQNMTCSLQSFFNWCVDRKYLKENPLKNISKFDTSPEIMRRDLTPEEIQKMLNSAPMYMRFLLATALTSGLRKGELRALSVDHLDVENATLRVMADVDKGRKERLQPIPAYLVQPLYDFAMSGEPKRLYDRFKKGKDSTNGIPENPLLFVPKMAAEAIKNIAKKAGVEAMSFDGKLDFHGCRTTFVNLAIDTGADVKTVQESARHDTADMTMRVYARRKQDKIAAVAEKVGEVVGIRPFYLAGPSGVPPKAAEIESLYHADSYDANSTGSSPVGDRKFLRYQLFFFNFGRGISRFEVIRTVIWNSRSFAL